MPSLATQRYINHRLIRAQTLRKCIRDLDSDPLFLDTNLLILARENLVAEYQHTVKQLEIELDRQNNRDLIPD